MKVLVPVLVLFFAAGPAPAGELPRMPAPPSGVVVGPPFSPETDPQILAIRARQHEALARGDRSELKRLEGEVQAILLSRQPTPESPGVTVRWTGPRPGQCRFAGPDAVIDTGLFISTAADYTMDGYMYVAAFRLGDSTVYGYRSTDHGLSWQTLFGFGIAPPGGPQLIRRLGLCVGEGDSAFIHVFCVQPEPYNNLLLIRVEMDGSAFTPFTVLVGNDTVSDITVCRDYSGSNYWLYAVAVNDMGVGPVNAWYLRSTDYGKHWAQTDSSGNTLHPHYSFGAGSCLYYTIAGPDSSAARGLVLVCRNPMYGASGEWEEQGIWPDTFSVRDPVIAPAFTLPESTAAVWSLFSHDNQGTGDWDILYGWSTDGGRSWGNAHSLAATPAADERYADLRNYTAPGNTFVNGSYISEIGLDRTVFRQYATSLDPGTWYDTLRMNTRSAGTGRAMRPLLIHSPGAPGTGAGCVFVGAGLNGLYFSAPWLPGVSEAPSSQLEPRPRPLLCRGVFEWPGSSPARLFDATGRQVRKVMPGPNDMRALPTGVYHLRAESQSSGNRLLLLR